MIRDKLVQEYRHIVNQNYPYIDSLLDDCYLKIIDGCLNEMSPPYYYLGVYYPGKNNKEITLYQNELREIGKVFGMVDIVFINAKRILRDPFCSLKTQNPRLWLELYWISSQVITGLE
ncbi:MAG: hypothetical protein AB4062_01370 [Crocosphaera sp.]